MLKECQELFQYRHRYPSYLPTKDIYAILKQRTSWSHRSRPISICDLAQLEAEKYFREIKGAFNQAPWRSSVEDLSKPRQTGILKRIFFESLAVIIFIIFHFLTSVLSLLREKLFISNPCDIELYICFLKMKIV